jgi:hypothetical protein
MKTPHPLDSFNNDEVTSFRQIFYQKLPFPQHGNHPKIDATQPEQLIKRL